MFKKKEKESIVGQLSKELGHTASSLYEYIFVAGINDNDKKKKDEIEENRKLFADLLSDYIEERIEEDYTECSECGCLIANQKVQVVKRGNATIDYCKHCKPPYDEILMEYDYEKEMDVVKGYLKNGVACDENGKIKA